MGVRRILSGGMENMREAMPYRGSYSFAQDVQRRMVRLQLSAIVLTAMW